MPSQPANVMSAYVQRPAEPRTVLAARYIYGQPTGDLHALAERDTPTAAMVEIPEWRCLLIRLGPDPDDPDYLVVPDGSWLIYTPKHGHVTVRDNDAFTAEYRPPQPGRLGAVAATIGQHMVLRESAEQIAAAALATADQFRAQDGTAA